MSETAKKTRGAGLFFKIFIGYIISVLIITFLTVSVIVSSSEFIKRSHEAENEIVPNTLKAKELQLHVIQVQQWLTDISATRAAPGYDDGYDEAAEHASAFTEKVNEFKSFYQARGDSATVSELDALQSDFDAYYDMGKQMAAAYIEFGPDKGNEFMEKFDPFAEAITEKVDGFVDKQTALLTETTSVIRERADMLRLVTFLVSASAAVILLVVGFVLSRKTVGPIKKFTAILKDISEGEGDLTRRIEINSKDEIGDMALYFNSTFEKIRELVSIVQNQSDKLSEVGVSLSSNMTETASAINQITANIQSIKGQTVNQAASVTETGSTMEHISVGIDKLNQLIGDQAKNISESSESIGTLIESIDAVAETLAKNGENIKKLSDNSESGKDALDKITAAIADVSKESESLMEISDVINAIANETNLLAMNAAIEAAHAGDSGKGFAVVADEVRKLAESSASQTKTIESALKKITESITAVFSLSDEVVEKFNSIAQNVAVVAKQEEDIRVSMEEQSQSGSRARQSIAELNDITKKVKESSSEMFEGSQQVASEARNMTAITEEINCGMGEMAAGADQITEAVSAVNSLVIENRESIGALLDEVKRFKV